MTDPDSGYTLGSTGYRRVTGSLFLAGFTTFALLYFTQPALPDIAAEFGITPASAALSVSFATIGLGLALLVAGPVSERRGRTTLMLGSLFSSSIVGFGCAVAPTWHVLLTLRALQGVLLAGLPAVAMAYLTEEMSHAAQARAAGVYVGGTALGGLAARLLNALVTDLAGWRWALAVISLAGLLAAVAVFVLLPRSRHFQPSPAGPAHLLRQTRALLGDRALLALFVVGFSVMGAFVAIFNVIAFRLRSAPYSLGPGQAGGVYLVYLLGSWASARTGAQIDKHGRRAIGPWWAITLLIGLAITLFTPLPLLILGLAVLSVGFFGTHGLASGWVAARAKAGVGAPGQASSIYLFSYYAGGSTFGALAGVAWTQGQWSAVVAVTAVPVASAIAAMLALRRIPSLLESERPITGDTAY